MVLEFLFIKLLVFLKTILESILKTIIIIFFFYYYSINPFCMGKGQVQSPFSFLFVFFSVRDKTLNFFEFYFNALRRFLANFQGYIASFSQKLFQTAWKRCQKLSKSESDKKEHIQLLIFSCSKVSYYLGLKAWKV